MSKIYLNYHQDSTEKLKSTEKIVQNDFSLSTPAILRSRY